MFWLGLLLVVIPCLLLWNYLVRKRRNDILGQVPGPPALPFLGNVLVYWNVDNEHIMDFVLANRKRYGKLYRVWVFDQLNIFSTDPRDVEIVLSSPKYITKNNLYDMIRCWLGTGLLMSTGRKWHSRRKIITPTFHFKILEHFVEIFDQQSDILVTQLEQHADGKTPLNIFPIVCLTALDIIAETAMGTKINAQMQPDLPYVRAVFEATNILTVRLIKPWQRIEWLFRLVEPGLAKRQDDLVKEMHDFTDAIIQQRREMLVKDQQENIGKENGDNEDVLGQKRRMALLDVLLHSTVDGVPLSNEDIREEVDTFMFEGHDTTTSGIAFCFYEISRHAAVQQRLLHEIHDVLGTKKVGPVSLRDLNELKYMECVIKEALRLHPPVPIIGRYFSEDTEIRGQRFPAGTNYTVGIYALLRDPGDFYAPNEFRPERFASEENKTTSHKQQEQQQPHPYAYIPFSAGPRNCIGQKFAILEMKSTISKVLQRYELLPLGPEPRPMISLVLRSANGIHLGLRARAEQ